MNLKKGDTIIITSPAGRVLDENVDNAVITFESWGLKVLVAPNAKKEYFNFSGTEEERLSDLQWALDHVEAKVIFASRGGYGAIHLLNQLDWSLFKKHPKLLVGYSDISNLHAHINNLGFISLHALMPNSFPKYDESNLSLETLKESLFADSYSLDWTSTVPTKDARLTAEVLGGNLSILYSLQGTPYAPHYAGKLLFIEDVSEYLYHIDRMLHSFDLGGAFTDIKGVIVGNFTEMKDNDVPFGKSLEQIVLDVFSKYQIPIVFGLRAGHGSPTLALPLGKRGVLDIKDNRCRLQF
jgi:muramoyltetrapeptide carboxypeptidase